MTKLESAFEKELLKELDDMFPGCLILKNNSAWRQGIPDRVIFFRDKYAFLEVKRSANEPRQPNQEWYVDMINTTMSFAAVIYPENKEEVLRGLYSALQPRGKTRNPQR